MDEIKLIHAARRGDEAAFEQLVRLYEKKVYNLCLRLCGDPEDAAEAAQDTFLALWRSLESFREDAALSTWLYRLASNACIDLLRRNKRSVEGVSLDDEELRLEVRDRAPTPEQHMERQEMLRAVREGVNALPPEYRQVLILRELHQLSYAEISEAAALEMGTVKSRISRARQLLKNYLSADGNFFDPSASKVTECNNLLEGRGTQNEKL